MSPAAPLKFATKGTMHQPIVITIDGKDYEVARLNRALFEDLQKLEGQVKQGKVGALYDQILKMTTAPKAVVDALDIRDVRDLVRGIRNRVAGKDVPVDEKNELKPGPTPAGK